MQNNVMSKKDNDIYKGWEKIKDYKFRGLTPLEKLQFKQAQAEEEYGRNVKFVLGEPLPPRKI